MKQKEEHLQQIITTLETDYKDGVPMSAIRVDDVSTGVFNILCNSTNIDLIRDYGSASGFFENLSKSNVKSIRIIPLKRNGTKGGVVNWTKSRKILPLEMGFTGNGPVDEKPLVEEKKQVHESFQLPGNSFPQLNGGMAGEVYHKFYDHQRLQNENIELKAENKAQQVQIADLKEKVLTNDLVGTKSVEKAQANADLLEKGQGYVPLIIEAIKSLKPQPVMNGLAGPISPIKERFLKVDDELLMDLEQVGMRCENQAFIDELRLLVEKYPVA